MRRELNKKRGDEVAEVLFFVLVPKIKVEKRQRGLSGIAQGHDMFYDGRAFVIISFIFLGMIVGK